MWSIRGKVGDRDLVCFYFDCRSCSLLELEEHIELTSAHRHPDLEYIRKELARNGVTLKRTLVNTARQIERIKQKL